MEFPEHYQIYAERIEKALPLLMPPQPPQDGGLAAEAARYSLLAGGKRIRPVLLLAVTDLLLADQALALPFACALELIHTYSLIHDDLPCMDDDDLRRGRPTCHKAYGEGIAVLAGDLLLTRAAEILLDAVDLEKPGTLAAARQIIRAAGGGGMIAGQVLDLAAEGRQLEPAELKRMHRLKTGALLLAPVQAAVSLAGASPAVAGHLLDYGRSVGLAFQIQDDILDVIAVADALGKSAGKDRRDDKPTYVSLFGLEEAQNQLAATLAAAGDALAALARMRYDTGFLAGLTGFFQTRTH